MTRIVCLSDTHWCRPPRLPAGDIVIHAGDGTEWSEFEDWVRWSGAYALSGNHDGIELELNDRMVEVAGLTIYGMPWTPEYGSWWHMLPRNSDELKAKVDAIPDGLDILVTHGPPYGTLDQVRPDRMHLGCELLYLRLREMSRPPRLHVFGHIHGGYGVVDRREWDASSTVYVNASIVDEGYKPVNKPIVVEL